LEIEGELRILASIPRRFVAYMLDTVPFTALWTVILATTDRTVRGGRSLGILGWVALFIAYFTVAIARHGRTLGMWAARICVVSVDTGENHGGPARCSEPWCS
jgi:uncharacterized RDD family membrane protein YckC